MRPTQANLHMLETWPKERIKTHERREYRSDRRGFATPITSTLFRRYLALKGEGRKFMEIRAELNISSATMKRLRAQAWAMRRG